MIDKSKIGKEYPPFSFEVEKGKIREFARAIGDKKPIYYEEEVAKKEGFDGLVAPPTFGTVLYISGNVMYTILEDLQADLTKMLQGGQEYEYFKLIHPGMIITGKSRISELFEKESKSGKMQFLVIETEYRDQSEEKVLGEKLTVIFRE